MPIINKTVSDTLSLAEHLPTPARWYILIEDTPLDLQETLDQHGTIRLDLVDDTPLEFNEDEFDIHLQNPRIHVDEEPLIFTEFIHRGGTIRVDVTETIDLEEAREARNTTIIISESEALTIVETLTPVLLLDKTHLHVSDALVLFESLTRLRPQLDVTESIILTEVISVINARLALSLSDVITFHESASGSKSRPINEIFSIHEGVCLMMTYNRTLTDVLTFVEGVTIEFQGDDNPGNNPGQGPTPNLDGFTFNVTLAKIISDRIYILENVVVQRNGVIYLGECP